MSRFVDRLPSGEHECRAARHLVLQQRPPAEPSADDGADTGDGGRVGAGVTDDMLAAALPACAFLESAVLSGVRDLSDRSVVRLAHAAPGLEGVDLAGCRGVTDVAVLELAAQSLPLRWLRLSGVAGLTDGSVSALAKSCPRLVELELCDLPLVTAASIRDLWTHSRTLRALRLARCPLLTDKAFPAPPHPPDAPLTRLADAADAAAAAADAAADPRAQAGGGATWLDDLPPLVLRPAADSLRVLDLACNARLTDAAVAGVVAHAPKLQTLVLSGCTALTDAALEAVCALGDHLDILLLAHVAHVTDRAIVRLARACTKIRSIDLSFCRNLTDMSVFELAGGAGLRRLSLVRVHQLTDHALSFLAEHARGLERLHLSYCDRLSLEGLHLLLRRGRALQYLTATGVPALRRAGVARFSDPPPAAYDADQRGAFRVFSGRNIAALARFLDKEDARRREAEARNIPFVPREDDSMDLY